MTKRIILGICFLTLVASVGWAKPKKKTTTVVGLADSSVDRDNIQAAIDASSNGDTVELVGLFLMDGGNILIQKSHLTLEGRVIDNDNDGQANEDWADGADNDGDGSVDEDGWDAEIRGVDDGGGGPAFVSRSNFNRTIQVQGMTGTAQNSTIRNLKITRSARGIALSPDTVFLEGHYCDDIIVTGGLAKNWKIEGNLFFNNARGFQIFGSSHGVQVRSNVFTDNTGIGVLLVGGESACWDGDESRVSIEVGTPANTQVNDNLLAADGGGFGLYSALTRNTKFRRNGVTNIAYGLISTEDDHAKFQHNLVTDCFIGFDGEGASSNVQISTNSFENCTYGVALQFDASGYSAVNNTVTGSGDVDYYLDDTTTNNTIHLNDPANTVTDLATGNTILPPD